MGVFCFFCRVREISDIPQYSRYCSFHNCVKKNSYKHKKKNKTNHIREMNNKNTVIWEKLKNKQKSKSETVLISLIKRTVLKAIHSPPENKFLPYPRFKTVLLFYMLILFYLCIK